jgi:prepilin peptidase CpaA
MNLASYRLQKKTMEEFRSLLELLTLLIADPRIAILFVLLIIAAVSDWRSYRIPNWLTFGGMAFGLLYNAASPAFLHTGFLWALGGLALGFVMMLPMYLLKTMGAGDVKLMAMIGAFLGAPDTFHAALSSFLVGGLAALAFALFHRSLLRMLSNTASVVQAMAWSTLARTLPDARIAASQSVGKLPYGVSIGIGTMGYLVARQLGYV